MLRVYAYKVVHVCSISHSQLVYSSPKTSEIQETRTTLYMLKNLRERNALLVGGGGGGGIFSVLFLKKMTLPSIVRFQLRYSDLRVSGIMP